MQVFNDFDALDAEIEEQTTVITGNKVNLLERMENVHLGTVTKSKAMTELKKRTASSYGKIRDRSN